MTPVERTKTCACGAVWSYEALHLDSGGEFPCPTMCPACATAAREAVAEAEAEEVRRNREIGFARLCPPLYLDTDRARLPAAALAAVEGWVYSRTVGRGLLCVGPTGRGKTRCAWLLVRKLHLAGVRWMAVSEAEFSARLERMRAEREGYGWLDRLNGCQVLFLDDLGHAATSGKYLEQLWQVVEHRCRNRLPIVATTQFSPDEMVAKTNVRGGEKTVQAIMRRLQDACDIVEFP